MYQYDGENLTLAVADGADASPVVMPRHDEREHGRGVAIVEELGATRDIRRTYLGNLVLLCGHHHHLVHHHGWDVDIGPDGHPRFYPPPWIDPTRTPDHPGEHPPSAHRPKRSSTARISG